MKIIVALGNPTSKYEMTKHNIGFMIADFFADKYGLSFSNETKFKAQIAKVQIANEAIIIVKPQTFMNLSGEAVSLIMHYYKADINDVLVVFDDLSLNLGNLRFRSSGSDGGHNGIKSVIQNFGGKNNFDRLKVGIGPQPPFMASENFVLSNFSEEEKTLLKKVVKYSVEAIDYYIQNGITEAQNKFNGAIE